VVENIALPLVYRGVPRAQRQARAIEMAEKLGLGHRLGHKPRELSGGRCSALPSPRIVSERDIAGREPNRQPRQQHSAES
jgi:predicted ABC-type transport system involved in lysophospholipase L1 biosynthesis ATPase subunit